APKLARHSHGAQVFTAWASVKLQGVTSADVASNGFPLPPVPRTLPGALSPFSAGLEVVIPTPALMRNRDVVRNYWRLVEKYHAAVIAAVPTILAALAEVPIGAREH